MNVATMISRRSAPLEFPSHKQWRFDWNPGGTGERIKTVVHVHRPETGSLLLEPIDGRDNARYSRI